MYHPTSFFC